VSLHMRVLNVAVLYTTFADHEKTLTDFASIHRKCCVWKIDVALVGDPHTSVRSGSVC
jgi:hypothetical protein